MRVLFFLILCLKTSVILATYNSSILREIRRSTNESSSQAQDEHQNGQVKFENSLITEDTRGSDLTSIICSTFPATCSGLSSFTSQFFHLGAFEGRGPKDLIAIVSTMLATLLGAILVKLNVLIVLSLISVGIGKILVLLLTLKSHLFAHKQQQPIVYEKIYYPHHKEYTNQIPQTNHDDYSTYNLSR